MLSPEQLIPLGPKTTLKIGGLAKWYAELGSKEDCEEAVAFATDQGCKLITLGAGSNTIFADGMVEALVVRITASDTKVDGKMVTVEAGKNLATLINELAEEDLDLSALTGIPGTVGGAVYGNAGQGHGGIWIDNFIESVEAYVDGEWQTFSKEDLDFGYRTSAFKTMQSPVIWSVTFKVATKPQKEVEAEVERLLKKRIETQPHRKTAGSCFVSLEDGTPAWELIVDAGMQGESVGNIQVSEKHANFLTNVTTDIARFEDVVELITKIKDAVDRRNGTDLRVEMQCFEEDGKLAF